MRIALVTTVKNEAASIRQHLAYHQHLGVTDVILFLEGSQDGTRERIRDLPNLRLFEGLTFQDLLPHIQGRPELDPAAMEPLFATHLGIRQVAYANHALALCRDAGIDWMLFLDQDELLCLDPKHSAKDALQGFLGGLDPAVGAVSFRNLELLPTVEEEACPFDGRLFKNRGVDPGAPGWPKAEIYNPFSRRQEQAGWFWGHNSGKLALRPGRDAYYISSHRCHTPGALLEADALLHYNIRSFTHFANKYRNFAGYPQRPNVRPLRMLLIRLVNQAGFSNEELTAFYRRHVMYAPQDVARIRRLNPRAIVQIDSVADFFAGQAARAG